MESGTTATSEKKWFTLMEDYAQPEETRQASPQLEQQKRASLTDQFEMVNISYDDRTLDEKVNDFALLELSSDPNETAPTMRYTPSLIDRVKNSPTAICAGTAITCSLVAILNPPLGLTLACVALGTYFSSSEHRKRAAYEVSLIYSLMRKEKWWYEISEGIILSGLPLAETPFGKRDDADKLIEEYKVDSVLSVVEPPEFVPGLFIPNQPEEWTEKQKEHNQISATDFLPVQQDYIEKGVAIIAEARKEGKVIVVHCKAGVGRSATIILAYLLSTGYYPDPGVAITKAKEICPYINLNTDQTQALWTFHYRHSSG